MSDTEATSVLKWVRATERAPEECELCLTMDSEGAYYVAHFDGHANVWRPDSHDAHELTIEWWAYIYPPVVQWC